MNNNVLAGMACPACGSEGPFDIALTIWATARVSDDGFDYSEIRGSEASWGEGADCTCFDCNHNGTVGDFRLPHTSTPDRRHWSDHEDS